MVSTSQLLDALTAEQLQQALECLHKTDYSALDKAELVRLASRLVRQRSDLAGLLNHALSKGKALKVCRALDIPTSRHSKKAVVCGMADAAFPLKTGTATKKTGRGGKKVGSRRTPTTAARQRGSKKTRESQPSSNERWRTDPALAHRIVGGGRHETYGQVWKDVEWQPWCNWEMGPHPSTCNGLYEFGIGDPQTHLVTPIYVGKCLRRSKAFGVVQRVNEYKTSSGHKIDRFIHDHCDRIFVRYRFTDYPGGYEERLLSTFGFGASGDGMYMCNRRY